MSTVSEEELKNAAAIVKAYEAAKADPRRADSKDPEMRVRWTLEISEGGHIANQTSMQREENIAAACRMLTEHPELETRLNEYIDNERALVGKPAEKTLSLKDAAKAAVANLANISGGITPQNISVNAPPVVKSGSQAER